jgi:flagellar biosynthetic protein FliQ
MSIEEASEVVRQALVLAVLISAPLLLAGLVVGLIISLFQAVTQIQEQTLVFVPKIVAMVAVAVLLMPWIAARLSAFTQQTWSGWMP